MDVIHAIPSHIQNAKETMIEKKNSRSINTTQQFSFARLLINISFKFKFKFNSELKEEIKRENQC